MPPKTFIFIGRSGCGKGTQAKLLQEYLQERDPSAQQFYLETGNKFREFVAGKSHTAELAAGLMKESKRQPDFLAVWMWSHLFVEGAVDVHAHWIIDGTPRSMPEAVMLDTAMKFYSREKPYVVHLHVSRDWSERHLRSRGRADDKSEEDIKRRLDWYEEDVVPAIDYYKINSDYRYIEVSGEPAIEAVQAELVAKLEALS